MFTLHEWDPNTHRFTDWLLSRLTQTYTLFVGQVAPELQGSGPSVTADYLTRSAPGHEG